MEKLKVCYVNGKKKAPLYLRQTLSEDWKTVGGEGDQCGLHAATEFIPVSICSGHECDKEITKEFFITL